MKQAETEIKGKWQVEVKGERGGIKLALHWRERKEVQKDGELLCHIIFCVCATDTSLSSPTHCPIIYKLQAAVGQRCNKNSVWNNALKIAAPNSNARVLRVRVISSGLLIQPAPSLPSFINLPPVCVSFSVDTHAAHTCTHSHSHSDLDTDTESKIQDLHTKFLMQAISGATKRLSDCVC